MLKNTYTIAVFILMLPVDAFAHSPVKSDEKARQQQDALARQCEKFLSQPERERNTDSPVVKAMMKRCSALQTAPGQPEEPTHEH